MVEPKGNTKTVAVTIVFAACREVGSERKKMVSRPDLVGYVSLAVGVFFSLGWAIRYWQRVDWRELVMLLASICGVIGLMPQVVESYYVDDVSEFTLFFMTVYSSGTMFKIMVDYSFLLEAELHMKSEEIRTMMEIRFGGVLLRMCMYILLLGPFARHTRVSGYREVSIAFLVLFTAVTVLYFVRFVRLQARVRFSGSARESFW